MIVGVISVLAAGASSSARADNYFSLWGAYTDVRDFDFQVSTGTINTEFDNGYGFGAAIGWRLREVGIGNRLRAEAEVSYRSNDVDTHKLNGSALAGSAGDIESTAAMVNLLVDFSEQSSFSPYLGGGLGFAHVETDGFGVSTIPNVLSGGESVLAFQVMVGASWDISQSAEIFGEYRYFATDDPSVQTSAATGGVATEIEYQSNNVLLGVRFSY
jgi:opacity protein-like surface antigen